MRLARENDVPTPLQVKAIAALCVHPTIGAAAAAAGVGERTLQRWLAEDPVFRAGYREVRTSMLQQAQGVLAAAAGKAAATLCELLDLKSRPDIQLGAAKTIGAAAEKAAEQDAIVARLDDLEARVGTARKRSA